MFYLDKLLAQLAYPSAFSLCLGLFALLLMSLRWRRWSTTVLTLGILWLGLWSLPVVSDARCAARWKDSIPSKRLPTYPPPMRLWSWAVASPPRRRLALPRPGPRRGSRLARGARFTGPAKRHRVIISGGHLPWLGERTSEAVAMRQF